MNDADTVLATTVVAVFVVGGVVVIVVIHIVPVFMFPQRNSSLITHVLNVLCK